MRNPPGLLVQFSPLSAFALESYSACCENAGVYLCTSVIVSLSSVNFKLL